jgi:hypothetical protein
MRAITRLDSGFGSAGERAPMRSLPCNAEGKATSETSVYSFDVHLVDTQIEVMPKGTALTVQMGNRADTPEEFAKSMTRKGKTSDATRIVLQCLLNTQCVHKAGGQVNLVQVYCDPEATCDGVLSHIVEVLAMMTRAPH